MWWLKTMLLGTRKAPRRSIYFHNTLGNILQEFTLPKSGSVKMYNCGPTVYDVQHIGNLAMFVFADVLRRVLEYNGLVVKQVINVTDFGHLVSDADEGEDKMSKGLRREGLAITMENMRTLADKYTQVFLEDIRKLNVTVESIQFPRASAYVPDQIAMIQTLEEKGYAYRGRGGVYFDTARFSRYGALGNVGTSKQEEGARVARDPDKKNPADFLLWKSDEKIGWDSPWGNGFPGWHIECSAMAHSLLGDRIDIHTGGPEHVAVHHNNEIAQSEAASGKSPFSRFWLHRAWIQFDSGKMAKSEGNVVYLADIIARGFDPLVFRYWLLTAHYRTPANFTWEALGAAHNALHKLRYDSWLFFKESAQGSATVYEKQFLERINDDLDTPGALAVMWNLLKDVSIAANEKIAVLKKFDTVLGLDISKYVDHTNEAPPDVERLVSERAQARNAQNWARADELRKEIGHLGYDVKDTEHGPRVSKRN